MNQLWRNTLLAFGLENGGLSDYPFENVFFSVVHHPGNHALDLSMDEFRTLLKTPDRFSFFTSDRLVDRAEQLGETALSAWSSWYRGLYHL
jgi:hypothetical protein